MFDLACMQKCMYRYFLLKKECFANASRTAPETSGFYHRQLTLTDGFQPMLLLYSESHSNKPNYICRVMPDLHRSQNHCHIPQR